LTGNEPTHGPEPGVMPGSWTTIEVTGVAGSGKSTAVRALCGRLSYRRGPSLHARHPSHLLEIVRSVPRLRAILIDGLVHPRRITWRELKLLAYVERGWRILERERDQRAEAVVLDQGPIYALVRLGAEGAAFSRRPAFVAWRRQQVSLWAKHLRVVVWLDAPDDVLWERINGRDQGHGQKGKPPLEGKRFLRRYRHAFDELLTSLEGAGGPPVVRIDTAASRPDEVVGAIVDVVESATTPPDPRWAGLR
jgi:thymidylate kinase